MTPPAPLAPPDKALKRVLLISGLDGWGMVAIGGLGLVLALVTGGPIAAAISALILTGGVVELRGRRWLKRREATAGMRLLIRAQVLVLAVILSYCVRCIGSFDAGYVKEFVVPNVDTTLQALLGVSLNDFLAEGGMTIDDLIPLAHRMFLLIYGAVALASLLCQGGLALYYRRRIDLVTTALAPPPKL